jgi:hypothetical protein
MIAVVVPLAKACACNQTNAYVFLLIRAVQAWSILERELDAAVVGVDGGARQWLLNSLEETAVVVSNAMQHTTNYI